MIPNRRYSSQVTKTIKYPRFLQFGIDRWFFFSVLPYILEILPTPNILMHQTLLLTMTYHSAQSCNVHVCVGPISDFRLGFFSTDPEKCADSKTLSCFVFFNADFFFSCAWWLQCQYGNIQFKHSVKMICRSNVQSFKCSYLLLNKWNMCTIYPALNWWMAKGERNNTFDGGIYLTVRAVN